uniref:Uncharacterized protein n=1 Tax=Glossina austeni TaxID=7395 RepID=A0A1A9VPN8_GLOAU
MKTSQANKYIFGVSRTLPENGSTVAGTSVISPSIWLTLRTTSNPDYDPRYWSQVNSNEDVNYNHYFNDGSHHELLNINVPPITKVYQSFLNDIFYDKILEINYDEIIN